MKTIQPNEILNTVIEIFELPEGTAESTAVQVDSLASLSLMAQAASRWQVRLNPATLETMGSIREIVDFISAAVA